MIDDERDQIYVTTVCGVDALEVGTGRRLSPTRLGRRVRHPVIDRLHDIVFVPKRAGRLWALDRRTLEVPGSLLIGPPQPVVERRQPASQALGRGTSTGHRRAGEGI